MVCLSVVQFVVPRLTLAQLRHKIRYSNVKTLLWIRAVSNLYFSVEVHTIPDELHIGL